MVGLTSNETSHGRRHTGQHKGVSTGRLRVPSAGLNSTNEHRSGWHRTARTTVPELRIWSGNRLEVRVLLPAVCAGGAHEHQWLPVGSIWVNIWAWPEKRSLSNSTMNLLSGW